MSEHSERYLKLLHAMQSGVLFTLPDGVHSGAPIPMDHGCSPKHLRVGVNAAMSDHGALVRLLIAKGVFTLEEYEKEAADGMQREVDSYTRELTEKRGVPVTLV